MKMKIIKRFIKDERDIVTATTMATDRQTALDFRCNYNGSYTKNNDLSIN